MTEAITPIRNSAVLPAEHEKAAEKKTDKQESSSKSSFASVSPHPWKTFVSGETSGEIPSEDVGPFIEELDRLGLGTSEESGLPGDMAPLPEELQKEAEAKAAAEEAAQGPVMIDKSQYGTAIDEIMGTLMLGTLDTAKPDARNLQMPVVPTLDDILQNDPSAVENLDTLLSRYDVSRKATLALLDSTTTALKTGQVSYFEAKTMQEYVHLLEENLLKIEQQIAKTRRMQQNHNVIDAANQARAEARENEEAGNPSRGRRGLPF